MGGIQEKNSMKFSTLSTTASLIAVAIADKVTLTTESSNTATNNKGLTNIHEGAGVNGFYLTDDASTQYDLDDGKLSQNLESVSAPYIVGTYIHTLVATLGAPFEVAASVTDNYVSVNGSTSVFYACKPVPFDPYGYSKESYGIAVFAEGESVSDGCESIKIKVSSGSSSPSSDTPVTSSTRAAGSKPSTHPAVGANKTVTEQVTKYTTIECSTPTTFAYGKSTYTVSSATTLTVEDCDCTATPAAPVPSATKSTPPSAPVVNRATSAQGSVACLILAATLLLV